MFAGRLVSASLTSSYLVNSITRKIHSSLQSLLTKKKNTLHNVLLGMHLNLNTHVAWVSVNECKRETVRDCRFTKATLQCTFKYKHTAEEKAALRIYCHRQQRKHGLDLGKSSRLLWETVWTTGTGNEKRKMSDCKKQLSSLKAPFLQNPRRGTMAEVTQVAASQLKCGQCDQKNFTLEMWSEVICSAKFLEHVNGLKCVFFFPPN